MAAADVRPPRDLRRTMLADMMASQALDEEGMLLAKQGSLDLWAPCRGQEAVQVGVAHATADFTIVPSYRETALALVRGARPEQIVAHLSGRTFCGWDPRALRLFPFALVLASQLLPAVGYNLGTRLRGHEEPVAVFFGDGASSEGDVAEAFNLAAVERAGVLFCCVNNGWAISKPSDDQMRTSVAERAAGFGIPSIRVDGRDPEDVWLTCTAEAGHVRAGEGPRLIEFITDRILSHTSNDAQEAYRTPDDIATSLAGDPVAAYRDRLSAEGSIDPAWLGDITQRTRALRAELAREYTR
ncbi:MAG: thiamine pyrophosphate-dependent dehydrogenase E1 component subunit alpha [Actinomycetia bacterium]|nr:thiamine pyrophosphate-dependent dehydrogenase E1 component subunit alpha [Actinomycetes bacterium]